MIQFFLSTWRAGFRSRSLLGVFLLGIALIGVAYLSASFSPRQPRTVALDVGLSGLRFSLVLFAITLMQDLVSREIDRRSVILVLSYPVHRASYVIGRYCGILALVATGAAILGLLLWIAVYLSGQHYEQQFPVALGAPYFVAIVGVWIDVAVVAAFTLWVATESTVSMLPLALGALFAIAGRALGPIADYVIKGADGQADLTSSYGPSLSIARWMLPDLSRLDWRIWPMYAQSPDYSAMWLGGLMAVLYVGLMLGLAVSAFSRREFS